MRLSASLIWLSCRGRFKSKNLIALEGNIRAGYDDGIQFDKMHLCHHQTVILKIEGFMDAVWHRQMTPCENISRICKLFCETHCSSLNMWGYEHFFGGDKRNSCSNPWSSKHVWVNFYDPRWENHIALSLGFVKSISWDILQLSPSSAIGNKLLCPDVTLIGTTSWWEWKQ